MLSRIKVLAFSSFAVQWAIEETCCQGLEQSVKQQQMSQYQRIFLFLFFRFYWIEISASVFYGWPGQNMLILSKDDQYRTYTMCIIVDEYRKGYVSSTDNPKHEWCMSVLYCSP